MYAFYLAKMKNTVISKAPHIDKHVYDFSDICHGTCIEKQ